VAAAVALLDEGATVPFIARYRKEVTGGLDDTQLRMLEERLIYLRELNQRRETILDSIRTQGKLTPELEQAILDADTKTLLEDLYLPYKPKRRTKAQIAREAGLEPLADALLENRDLIPEQAAVAYIDADKGVADVVKSSWNAFPKMRSCCPNCANAFGVRAFFNPRSLAARRPKRLNSRIILNTAKPSIKFRHIGRWPCFAAAMRICCI
jgi:hypothetical protein